MHQFPQSQSLFERAAKVIPGGLYGHTQPAATLPGKFPYFAERASGCKFQDVDGNEFIDYMCGYGPVILGHADQRLEEAVSGIRSKGLCYPLPSKPLVELSELLIDRVDFADWAVFGKNGSDMTTWALQVAREATGRKKVLHVAGAYHGVDAWVTPGHGGIIPEDRNHVHTFPWNDTAQASQFFDQLGGQIAAVFVTPYHHPNYSASILPEPGFFSSLKKLCYMHGSLLILDDIRAGFRLHPGGSHVVFDLEPDLACYCKALANGYPVSACLGKETFRKAARQVFLTGSYWNDPVALTAAKYTLTRIKEEEIPGELERLGKKLAKGLSQAAAAHKLSFNLTGPPAAPYPVFKDDPNLFRIQAFSSAAIEEGLFFHPHHNWFLCQAHTDTVIEETLQRAERAFAKVAREA